MTAFGNDASMARRYILRVAGRGASSLSALLMGRVFDTDLPPHRWFCLLALANERNSEGARVE